MNWDGIFWDQYKTLAGLTVVSSSIFNSWKVWQSAPLEYMFTLQREGKRERVLPSYTGRHPPPAWPWVWACPEQRRSPHTAAYTQSSTGSWTQARAIRLLIKSHGHLPRLGASDPSKRLFTMEWPSVRCRNDPHLPTWSFLPGRSSGSRSKFSAEHDCGFRSLINWSWDNHIRSCAGRN